MDSWRRAKQSAMDRLIKDREIGYLDPDIWDLLMAFFRREKSFTNSSCSGRITVIDAEYPWSRKGSTVIFKNHLGITERDLREVLDKGALRRLWLVVQGPILHVYTQDMEEAWEILRLARLAGFKHSGILTVNSNGVLVELRTGIKLTHLLVGEGTSEPEVGSAVKLANEVLTRGKEKMHALRRQVELSVRDNPVELGQHPKG